MGIGSLLKYHQQFIYPTDYQLLRIINLAMIFSGTLFEMLRVYDPETVELTQAEYSNVDEGDSFDEVTEEFDVDGQQQRNGMRNRKNKKGNNKRKKNQKKTNAKKSK